MLATSVYEWGLVAVGVAVDGVVVEGLRILLDRIRNPHGKY